MRPLRAAPLVLLVLACGGHGAPASAPSAPPLPPAHPHPTAEALARKERSEARLAAMGVRGDAELPVIDTADEATPRTKNEVVDRALALMFVAVKGEGLEQEHVDRGIERFGAADVFSPHERRFIHDPDPDEQTRAQFAWRYEDLAVMLWALGFEAQLSPPDQLADAGALVRKVMTDEGPERFRADAHLRPFAEVLDEADLVYREDWVCVDARSGGAAAPGALNCELVVERHTALNWLIGYQHAAWDDVSPDT